MHSWRQNAAHMPTLFPSMGGWCKFLTFLWAGNALFVGQRWSGVPLHDVAGAIREPEWWIKLKIYTDLSQCWFDAPERTIIERGVESDVEAPEILFDQEHTAKIDVFSCILILFEIVTGLLTRGRISPWEGFGKLQVNALKCQDLFLNFSLC
jgi:hypothetical protein